MFIRSKIKESGNTIFLIDFDDVPSNDKNVVQENKTHELGVYGNVISNKIYTNGLCILEANFQLYKKITDLFTVEGEHIHLSFIVKGQSEITLIGDIFTLDRGLVRVSFQDYTKLEVEMQADESIRYIAVFMSKTYFLKLFETELWFQNSKIFQDVLENRYFNLQEITSYISPQVLNLLYQIFDSEQLAVNRAYHIYFIEMKLREILFFLNLQLQESSLANLTIESKTLSALQKARGLITANFTNPPSIKQLSRDVSLNEQQLKQGFKQLYGETIYSYVLQLRMNEASRLVSNPNLSISTISEMLGYKTSSHFIVAFKKKFGYTPKQAAKKHLA